jgi:hypothetical protein
MKYLLGSLSILLGISIFIDPTYYDTKHRMFIDHTYTRYLLCPLLICVGLYSIYKALTTKELQVICPKCQTVSKIYTSLSLSKCLKCNVELEELKDFYDKHPDLKDKNFQSDKNA